MTDLITLEIHAPLLRDLEIAAGRLGRTREALVQGAISAFVAAENRQVALIEAGLTQIALGDRHAGRDGAARGELSSRSGTIAWARAARGYLKAAADYVADRGAHRGIRSIVRRSSGGNPSRLPA